MKTVHNAVKSDTGGIDGVFVTGTDTGVGKTYIGTALAHLLTQRGLRVRPRKPVESGCATAKGSLLPQDAAALREAACSSEPLEQVCAYPLRAALSPERAAALEGCTLILEQLVSACRSGVGTGDFLLVEGAGGWLSPVAPGATNADLAATLRLPVLVVAADRLGVINHTLLTVEAVSSRKLPLAGVVLNQTAPATDPLMDNAADLTRWLGWPVGLVPHRPGGETHLGMASAPFLRDLADRITAAQDKPGRGGT